MIMSGLLSRLEDVQHWSVCVVRITLVVSTVR